MTKNLADELQRTARLAMTGINPLPQGEEPGGLPFRKLLAAAFRARYLLFGTTLFGTLIGAFLAITTPNTYVSRGMFLFTGSGAESTTFDPTSATKTSQETIATGAAYILSASALLERVVEKVTPAKILQPYRPGEDDNATGFKALFHRIQRDWNATKTEDMTEDEALKRLRKTIVVERPQYKDVLVATCTANDPGLAQEILHTFMSEAIDWHIQQYDDERAYEDAKKAVSEAQGTRDTAYRSLHDFLDRKALVSQFDEEKMRLQAAEIEATTRVTKLGDDLKIAEAQAKNLREQLDANAIKPTVTVMKPQLTMSVGLAKLQEQLIEKQIKVNEIKRSFLNQQEDVIKGLEVQIENIKTTMQQLAEQERNSPSIPTEEVNPEYTNARLELAKFNGQVSSLGAQIQLATEWQESAVKKLKRLVDLEPEFVALRDGYNRSEENLQRCQSSWDEAQRKRALGIGKYSALKDFEKASYPLEKEGPNRSKLLIGGLFGGLFLGIALIVMRSLPDTVVRTRDDLERLEGLPVIGLMPRLDNANLRRHLALREQGW